MRERAIPYTIDKNGLLTVNISDLVNSPAFRAQIDAATRLSTPAPTNPAEIGSKSVVEPTAEHWRRAIKERGIENPKALDWIEQRARELAQEGE